MKNAMRLVNPKMRLVLASAETDKAMLREAFAREAQKSEPVRMEKHGITFALGLVLGFVLALLMVATDVRGAY